MSIDGAVRRMHDEQVARDKYDSFLRAHASDAVQVAFHAAGADRSDKDEPVARSVGNVSLTVAVQLDVEPVDLSDSGLDVADALMDVSHPEHIRGLRVEVKDGSVVVELHSHAAEHTDPEVAA